jgi:hypothetical protein
MSGSVTMLFPRTLKINASSLTMGPSSAGIRGDMEVPE